MNINLSKCLLAACYVMILVSFFFILSGCSAPLGINKFYATSASVSRGKAVQLCYEVVSANSISIEPLVENVTHKDSDCINVAPEQTTTYVLTATGHEGQIIKSDPVTVSVSGSHIVKFYEKRENPNMKAPKTPVELCYQVQEATSLRIEPEIGTIEPNNEGCHEVFPEKTTIYTLIATDSNNIPVESDPPLKIQVVQPPIKISLEFKPKTIYAGQTAQLCYRVENAERAIIKGLNGKEVNKPLKIGENEKCSKLLKVSRSQNVTLEAINIDEQSREAQATLTVIRPEIISFDSQPKLVEINNKVKLDLNVRNASRVELSDGRNPPTVVTGHKSFITPPISQDTKYTLVAENEFGGKEVRELVIKVTLPQQAKIRVAPSPTHPIKKNDSVELCFVATLNSSVEISAKNDLNAQPIKVHEVKATGKKQCKKFAPSATTLYILKAKGLNRKYSPPYSFLVTVNE